MPKTHIPAVAVVILRSALLSQLGVPAGELDEACMSPNKERHPERFLEPLQALDAHPARPGHSGRGRARASARLGRRRARDMATSARLTAIGFATAADVPRIRKGLVVAPRAPPPTKDAVRLPLAP